MKTRVRKLMGSDGLPRFIIEQQVPPYDLWSPQDETMSLETAKQMAEALATPQIVAEYGSSD